MCGVGRPLTCLFVRRRTSPSVDVRRRTSPSVDVRRRTSPYLFVRRHTSLYLFVRRRIGTRDSIGFGEERTHAGQICRLGLDGGEWTVET